MILLKRRRLIFWLLKAYIKRWGKSILLFFLLGLIAFFFLRWGSGYFVNRIPFAHQETIGLVGSFTTDNIPDEILSNVSRGLTKISSDGRVLPDIASSWDIRDNGKNYIFHIRKNVYFSDGKNLTSDDIRYNFSDAGEERPDKYTIIYKLKDRYAPFLVTVSHPILKDGFIGVGSYKLKNLNLNGDFIKSVDLASTKSNFNTISYLFYPTEEALKNAYVLGEVTRAENLSDINFKERSFSEFNNTIVEKNIDSTRLVSIFYNTQDQIVSDKRLREALSYAVPDIYTWGKTNRLPFPPESWASQTVTNLYSQDLEHAKLLLSQAQSATSEASLKLTIKTTSRYLDLAKFIAKSWKQIGVDTDIKQVDSLPSSFQIFLGDFIVSKDPDQYVLWHSDQPSNITNYKNLRIDKLLEDGRKTSDISERQKIYAEFEKYLLDDSPATFLYLPYSYNIIRK